MTKNTKMRNLPLILISVLMLSAIVYSVTSIRPAFAQPITTVMIDPPATAISNPTLNMQFNVSVTVANTTGIAGMQFEVNWDTTLLNCSKLTEVFYDTVTPEAFKSNIWNLGFKFNNTLGAANYAFTWMDLIIAESDGYAPANVTTAEFAEGKLAAFILTFNVTSLPPTGSFYDANFTISTAKIGNLTGLPIPIASVQNGTYRIYGPAETLTHPVTHGGTDYNVTTFSNASITPGTLNFTKVSDTKYDLDFNATGPTGTIGFVNVTIPINLMDIRPGNQWNVTVNGAVVTPTVAKDATNSYLYIVTPSLTGSSEEVVIIGTIPEFTLLFIPLLMAATLVAVGLRRRRRL